MMTDTHSLLVVDDDAVDRMAVQRALRKSDLEATVYEAENCQEAKEVLSRQAFSCVLLDYNLPDGNAIGFLKSLEELGLHIPTIILTGQGDEKIAVELMKAGASDYVLKDQLSPSYLSQSIRNALRIHQAEQEIAQANQRLRNTNLLLKEQNKQLEFQTKQIHLQNLELVEAARLKSQFLASMSHELRTPMHAIMGFSQILLQGTKGELSADQYKMVERILDNSNNLLTLLNDLLDFSKVEAGKLTLESQTFNLASLVLATIEELKSLALQKDLKLTSTIELTNRKFFGDDAWLRQVLVNLLSNAIKFTEIGEIVVSASEVDDSHIAIAVKDTGIGIASEQFESIFDPFIQANQTSSRKYPGTGLGLAISKSLVDMMDGEIQVESTLGEGTVFTIVLPRKSES